MISKFIPVNIKRENAYVTSNTEVYPAHLLERAYYNLQAGCIDPVIVVAENAIRFLDKPEILWYVDDVIKAHDAYTAALKSKFSYYEVRNEFGMPALYVSSQVKKTRWIVDAHSLQTIHLTDPKLIKRVTRLIDKHCVAQYLQEFFSALKKYTAGTAEYSAPIIVGRGSELEYYAISPLLNNYPENVFSYTLHDLECLDYLIDNEDAIEYDDFIRTLDGKIQRVGEDAWQTPMLLAHAKRVVQDYTNECCNGKSNFTTLYGNDVQDVLYYMSTNMRYIVDAFTFEKVTVKNIRVKELCKRYAEQASAPAAELHTLWKLAKAEV